MWLTYSLIATSVTPVGTATGDIVSYILGYGAVGVGVVLFALGYIVPKPVKDGAVSAARADLVAENERLRTELAKTQDQRDEAMRVARDQLAPLLTTFNATVTSLLPILQDIVRAREDQMRRREGPGR